MVTPSLIISLAGIRVFMPAFLAMTLSGAESVVPWINPLVSETKRFCVLPN